MKVFDYVANLDETRLAIFLFQLEAGKLKS